MPYNPSVNDRSGEILANGINEAMFTFKKQRDEVAAADATAQAIAGMYKQNGVPMPEGWEKYPSMSGSAKKAYVGQLGIGLHTALQQRQQEQSNQYQNMAAQIQAMQANRATAQDNRQQAQDQGIANAMMQAKASTMAGSADYSPVDPGQEQGAMQERLIQNLLSNPQTAGSPLAQRLAVERMQQGAAQPEFAPSGTMVDINGIQVPVVKTSRNSAQPLEGFATDAQGRASGKYRTSEGLTPAQEIQSIDRELGYFRKMIPAMMTEEDKARMKELTARKSAITGTGGNAGGAASVPLTAPKKGDTMDGYRFLGGDPGNPSNWTPAN
jgi:hypothetical protein